MKRGSTSLAVMEMEIKVIMMCTCTHQIGEFFVNKTQGLQRCVAKGTPTYYQWEHDLPLHFGEVNMTYLFKIPNMGLHLIEICLPKIAYSDNERYSRNNLYVLKGGLSE